MKIATLVSKKSGDKFNITRHGKTKRMGGKGTKWACSCGGKTGHGVRKPRICKHLFHVFRKGLPVKSGAAVRVVKFN